MTDPTSIERRLIVALAAIALVAVLGVLVLLPYRLYERDIRNATEQAQRVSSVVHSALSCPIGAGNDATDLVNRLQGNASLEIRLAKLARPEDHPLHASPVAASTREGTDLRYLVPPVLDRDGGSWLAEMHFDLAPLRRDSVRLIVDLMLAVTIGAAIFSAVIFALFRRALLLPLRELAERVDRIAGGEEGVALPEFRSREMAQLSGAIGRLTEARR